MSGNLSHGKILSMKCMSLGEYEAACEESGVCRKSCYL